jgi:hypothetical protein
LDDVAGLFNEWLRLVKSFAIVGRAVYDARLVAAMNLDRMTQILTFNTSDFAVYPNITVLDPVVVAASSAS